MFHTETRSVAPGPKAVAMDALRHGEKLSINARSVVISSGFGSHLIDRCGLEGVGDFVMGAQVEVELKDVTEVEVYTGGKHAPGFFAWLVPTAPGRALVGLLSRRYPPAYLRTLLARLQVEGRIVSADVPFTYGGVPLRPLPRTYSDRLLVVGTAAGQVKPLTGGGIYFGLLCADLAANALNRCLLQDDLSAERLATYQRAWQRRLGREFRTGYWARRVYERLNDGQIDGAAKLMVGTGLVNEIESSDALNFDWHADVVTHIFNQRTIMRAFRTIRLPFRLRKRLEEGIGAGEHPRLEKG
jgi:flavin-dependent dehydrogenase